MAKRREPTTAALVFQTVLDVFGLWGARWALQAISAVAFFGGLGLGAGWLIAWWTANRVCR